MKKLSLFTFFLLLPFYFFAESLFSFSLSTSIGLEPSLSKEQVYQNDSLLSELEWDTFNSSTPIYYADLNFFIWNFYLSTILSSSIPTKSGQMTDLDYLTSNKSISLFSQHDIYIDKNYSIKEVFGYNFPVIDCITISPYISFEYRNKKLSAKDGFLQYPNDGSDWTGTEEKTLMTGNIISYEVAMLLPGVGLNCDYTFLDKNTLSFSAEYIPFLQIHSIDSHYLRKLQFYDLMKNGYGFSSKIDYYRNFLNENTFLKIGLYYQYLFSRGDSLINNIGVKDNKYTLEENITAQFHSHSLGITAGLYILF